MKRIFHPYTEWEDYNNGMWRKVSSEENLILLPMAVAFMGDHILYGEAMRRVISEWPISCEHNLTDLSQNRRAWIGQAACSIEKGLPESTVREAWVQLTDIEKEQANHQANIAIDKWVNIHYNRKNNTNQSTLF